MVIVKYLTLILMFAVASSTVLHSNRIPVPGPGQTNFTTCDEVQDDWILIDKEEISVKGKYLQITELTVTYPRQANNDCYITCIKLIDLMPIEHGYPSILEGGIGFRYVTLQIRSQRSKGFKYQVEIWCKKRVD